MSAAQFRWLRLLEFARIPAGLWIGLLPADLVADVNVADPGVAA